MSSEALLDVLAPLFLLPHFPLFPSAHHLLQSHRSTPGLYLSSYCPFHLGYCSPLSFTTWGAAHSLGQLTCHLQEALSSWFPGSRLTVETESPAGRTVPDLQRQSRVRGWVRGWLFLKAWCASPQGLRILSVVLVKCTFCPYCLLGPSLPSISVSGSCLFLQDHQPP